MARARNLQPAVGDKIEVLTKRGYLVTGRVMNLAEELDGPVIDYAVVNDHQDPSCPEMRGDLCWAYLHQVEHVYPAVPA